MSGVDLVCRAMASGWLLGPGRTVCFAVPLWHCCLALVPVVLRVLDAIEAFRRCWLSVPPSEGVGPRCEFGFVVLDLIWLEWPFQVYF